MKLYSLCRFLVVFLTSHSLPTLFAFGFDPNFFLPHHHHTTLPSSTATSSTLSSSSSSLPANQESPTTTSKVPSQLDSKDTGSSTSPASEPTLSTSAFKDALHQGTTTSHSTSTPTILSPTNTQASSSSSTTNTPLLPAITQSTFSSSNGKKDTNTFIGAMVGLLVFLTLAGWFAIWTCRRRRAKQLAKMECEPIPFMMQRPPVYLQKGGPVPQPPPAYSGQRRREDGFLPLTSGEKRNSHPTYADWAVV
ncbi:hypothetical protein DL96DRAFT_118318 [Flagelloscypha sp. PMI_526]|nr:hypothetical protein DL96DRAFT_118318 [Flagelloscypha sp. PMI_526]